MERDRYFDSNTYYWYSTYIPISPLFPSKFLEVRGWAKSTRSRWAKSTRSLILVDNFKKKRENMLQMGRNDKKKSRII